MRVGSPTGGSAQFFVCFFIRMCATHKCISITNNISCSAQTPLPSYVPSTRILNFPLLGPKKNSKTGPKNLGRLASWASGHGEEEEGCLYRLQHTHRHNGT